MTRHDVSNERRATYRHHRENAAIVLLLVALPIGKSVHGLAVLASLAVASLIARARRERVNPLAVPRVAGPLALVATAIGPRLRPASVAFAVYTNESPCQLLTTFATYRESRRCTARRRGTCKRLSMNIQRTVSLNASDTDE